MPWTTVTNALTGDVLTASNFNNQVLGNLTALRGDYATSRFTTADKTLNSTTWADLSGPADLTLAASSGDIIECAFSAKWANEAVEGFLDVVTVVSSVVTNSFGTNGAPSNSHQGIVGWSAPVSVVSPVSGNFFYTLQAGDVSGGNVILRLRYRTSTAANKTLYANTNYPMVFFARNHGPVDI